MRPLKNFTRNCRPRASRKCYSLIGNDVDPRQRTPTFAASHDLQEPLRNVVTHSQLLKKKYYGNLDEEADQLIATIVGGAHRMGMLIRDLLAYTQVAKISEDVEMPVDTHAVLMKVMK